MLANVNSSQGTNRFDNISPSSTLRSVEDGPKCDHCRRYTASNSEPIFHGQQPEIRTMTFFKMYMNLTPTSNLSETWTATNRISVCRTYMGIIVGDAVEIVVILFCFPMFVFYGSWKDVISNEYMSLFLISFSMWIPTSSWNPTSS